MGAYLDPELVENLEFPSIFFTHRVNTWNAGEVVDADTEASKVGHSLALTGKEASIQEAGSVLVMPYGDQKMLEVTHDVFSPTDLAVATDDLIEDSETGIKYLVQRALDVGSLGKLWWYQVQEQVQGSANP